MLRNYLQVGLRSLRRRPASNLINVFGLATGLAACAIIALFVQSEWTADAFHDAGESVYRVTYEEVDTPAMRHLPTISPPMGPALAEEYADIEAFLRLRDSDRHQFRVGDRSFYESQFFYADSTFFDFFSYRFAYGTATDALSQPGTVVLTKPASVKYFGTENPVGQRMAMDNDRLLTVTGVIEPAAGQTHLDFDFLVSFSTFEVPRGYPVTLESWSWISFYTYVRLRPGTQPEALEAQFPEFMTRHFNADRAERVRLRLQPVEEIYLGTPRDPFFRSGSPTYLIGLSAIALLLLLIAAFNYTNLAVAESLTRAREAGIRRALGARTLDLVGQFVGEAVLVALVACGMAVGLASVGLALMEPWLGVDMTGRLPSTATVVLVLAVVAICTGGVAGLYPAWVASRFKPTEVLRGGGSSEVPGSAVRTALVTAQFTIAVAMIAGSFVIARQMSFIRDANLGFDTEQVIALSLPGEDLRTRYDALRHRLEQNPRVADVAQSGFLPGEMGGSVPIYPEGQPEGENIRTMRILGVHYNFFETLGIDVQHGRTFSRDVVSDSSRSLVLNRSAAEYFAATTPGWEDPIGKTMRVGQIIEGRVIGVTEDIHIGSLHHDIPPVVMYIPPTAMEHVLVRVRPGRSDEVVSSLQADWDAVIPDAPMDYTFLDDQVAQLYEADQRFYRAVQLFAGLALVLACLGLYGLGASVIRLRTREVGIRKVLGATMGSLVQRLSMSLLRPLGVAVVVACPLAYLAVDRWLQTFAYRVDVGIAAFLVAAGVTVGVAFLAISRHTIAAARRDPASVLRTD